MVESGGKLWSGELGLMGANCNCRWRKEDVKEGVY